MIAAIAPAPPKIRWPRRRRSAISVPATSYTRCSGVGDALSGPGGGVTPVAELVGKAGMGWLPTEFGPSSGCRRALIEQQHGGEILTQARSSLSIGARNRA